MKTTTAPAAALWLLAALTACTQPKSPAVVTASAPPVKPVVTVERVEKAPLIDTLVLNTVFQPANEVEVMSKLSGYVRKLHAEIGDRVAQGQLLATLEAPEAEDELAKALAALERTRSEADRARIEVQRAETSHQMAHLTAERIAGVAKSRPGMLAAQEVDDARNRDLIAESQVDTAKSGLAAAMKAVQISEAEVSKARKQQMYLQVTAPFAGVVTKRYVDTGTMVQAGTSSRTQAMPVMRISQSDVLRVVLAVPEAAVTQLRTGMAVELRAVSGQMMAGRVARVSNRIHPETRTMDAELDIDNRNGAILPGMSAEARLTLQHPIAALAVPQAAMDEAVGRASVMVVTRGSVEVRNIVVGTRSGNKAEVREGLQEGEAVIVSGRSGLVAGQQVEIGGRQ